MPGSELETVIADALTAAGFAFTMEREPERLDFHLTDYDVWIEVKAFHSPRIAEQMSRARCVIAVQGVEAVYWLAEVIKLSALIKLFGPYPEKPKMVPTVDYFGRCPICEVDTPFDDGGVWPPAFIEAHKLHLIDLLICQRWNPPIGVTS